MDTMNEAALRARVGRFVRFALVDYLAGSINRHITPAEASEAAQEARELLRELTVRRWEPDSPAWLDNL